jgi:prepilin-type N-terminal cleavage/methylation domain-containing protein
VRVSLPWLRPRERDRARPRRRHGFTLVEVLVSLSLVASVGVAATGVGLALSTLTARARAEAVALELASAKIEELAATPAAERADGFDEVATGAVPVTRMWRVAAGDPEPSITRLEVTARWKDAELVFLTLVAVTPGSTP